MNPKLLLYVGIVLVAISVIFQLLSYLPYIGVLLIAAYGVYWAYNRIKFIIDERRNTRKINID